MRRALCLSVAAAFLWNTTVVAEWRNTLQPAGTPGQQLTLARDGKALFGISLPKEPSGPERKAAEDLRQWIKEITGAELPLIDQSTPGGLIRIVTDQNAPSEQYSIGFDGENLVLSGGSGRGVINAVYALLEEDIGCRWFTKESIRMPKSRTLTMTPVARTYSPQLRLRDPFYDVSFNPVWSLRNRTSAPYAKVPEEHGGHMDYGGGMVHTHAALLPPKEYFKEHPEYFAQDAKGQRYAAQLCPTHPEVARIVIENVHKLLHANPNTEIVSISKNDNAGDQICHCTICDPLRQAEGGTDMANQLVLVNAVAQAIEQEFPNVLVDTLAYLETIKVPTTARPRKNVVVRLCNDAPGAWSTPFKPARECPIAKLVEQWSAAHERLSIWDYNVNFSHYLAPMPNLAVIANNIRFWVDHHAIGLLTQGGYQSTAERDELRSWVIAKLMWDPSRDVNALVTDFIQGVYGSAAGPIAEYDALLRETAEKHAATLAAPAGGIRYPMDVPFLSKEFLERATELFTRARELAGADETLLHRVEREELPILYVKLARGPGFVGPEYGAVLDRFERIARREGVRCLAEGRADLDGKLAAWRKQAETAGASAAAGQSR